MGMLITLAINNQRIDTIEVINRGPVGGVYELGDEPGGDGERIYEFTGRDGSGFVHHRRDEGAHVLASKVLMVIADAKSYPEGKRRMTDSYLMDADCIHGVAWYECVECPQPTDQEILDLGGVENPEDGGDG